MNETLSEGILLSIVSLLVVIVIAGFIHRKIRLNALRTSGAVAKNGFSKVKVPLSLFFFSFVDI